MFSNYSSSLNRDKLLDFVRKMFLLFSSVHIRTILDQSREDLSEARKILPDDVNEVLLPEGKRIHNLSESIKLPRSLHVLHVTNAACSRTEGSHLTQR